MIEELAAVVDAIGAAARSADELPALLSTLRRLPSRLFADAVLLKGGCGGAAFIVVRGREFTAGSRTWMRWPLRRLFARMQPSRITNPCALTQHALAIPFAYDTERYVVLASLTKRARDPDCGRFFGILERMTVPGVERVAPESGDIPVTPMEPIIAGFGLCEPLYERVDETLRRRGWTIENLRPFCDLWSRLQQATPDIIALDLDEIESPLTATLSIHRAADSAALRIVGFGDKRLSQYGSDAVIDRLLPHDADRETIFRVFKDLARDASMFRRTHVRDADVAAKRQAQSSLTPFELAGFAARRASEIMHGWAYCVLFSQSGTVYRAEEPALSTPVFSTIPKSFLGEAFFDVRVGDHFLTEVTDDAAERMALMALRPLSGATLPITYDNGERCGVLVACARHRWADSAAFEALKRLVRVVAARHRALGPSRLVIPEFTQERFWERLRDHGCEIDVYRSSDCGIPWRYRALTDTSAMLTLGVGDDAAFRLGRQERAKIANVEAMHVVASLENRVPSFAATIDFSTQSMTYAGHGFTPPISLAARGPIGSVQNVHGITTGTIALPHEGEAAVFDSTLWRWLSQQNETQQLRPLLDQEMPSGLASIVTLGSSRP